MGTYEDSIASEENLISSLKKRIVRIPRRSINWQHQNAGMASRNITQRVRIVRRDRAKIKTKVASSRRRIVSFRKAIISRDTLPVVEKII